MIESIKPISNKVYNKITVQIACKEYLEFVFVAGKIKNHKEIFNNNYI